MTIAAGKFCHQQCLHNQQRGSKHKFPRISLTKHWLLPLKPGSSLGVPQRGHSLMEGVSMMGLVKWILEPGYFFAHLQVSTTHLEENTPGFLLCLRFRFQH